MFQYQSIKIRDYQCSMLHAPSSSSHVFSAEGGHIDQPSRLVTLEVHVTGSCSTVILQTFHPRKLRVILPSSCKPAHRFPCTVRYIQVFQSMLLVNDWFDRIVCRSVVENQWIRMYLMHLRAVAHPVFPRKSVWWRLWTTTTYYCLGKPIQNQLVTAKRWRARPLATFQELSPVVRGKSFAHCSPFHWHALRMWNRFI